MAHQVNSPDRASNNSNDDNNDVSSGQLLNLRHALADAAGLTREQHAFISNDAPASLRDRHNALYRRTQNTFHMADMQHIVSGQATLTVLVCFCNFLWILVTSVLALSTVVDVINPMQ
ncbi:hypothetical protein [Pseudomonas amygdali]|nr:hypothetical protein [Pseudomonas amygdali]